MRWIFAISLVMVGCVASMPADDGISADLSCEAARMIVQLRTNKKPAPTPSSDRCDNCNGTGKVGDGRVSVVCPICDGTGKKPKSVLVHQ